MDLTGLNTTLQQIANPVVANIPGSFGGGMKMGQGIRSGIDKRNMLQQIASKSTEDASTSRALFSLNEAMGASGPSQIKLIEMALGEAPPNSSMQSVIQNLKDMPDEQRQTALKGIVDRATQQGLLKAAPKATKTPEQLQQELNIRQQEADTSAGMLEVQKTKAAKGPKLSPLGTLLAEMDSLAYDDPNRAFYLGKLKKMSSKKYDDIMNQAKSIAETIVMGQKDPSKVSMRGGLQAAVEHILASEYPGTNLIELSANARYKEDLVNLRSRALIGGVDNLFDALGELGTKLGNSNIPLVNKIRNTFKEQTGSPDIVGFNNMRDELVAEVERILLGSGVLSDDKYKRALKNLNSAQSPAQLEEALKVTEDVVLARLASLDSPAFGAASPHAETLRKKKGLSRQAKGRRATDKKPEQNRRATDNEADPMGIL